MSDADLKTIQLRLALLEDKLCTLVRILDAKGLLALETGCVTDEVAGPSGFDAAVAQWQLPA